MRRSFQVISFMQPLVALRQSACVVVAIFALTANESRAQRPVSNSHLLGAVLPISSHQGGAGVSFVRGASAAVKAANAGGGIAGKTILLQVENDEASPIDAAELTTELAKKGALAILGGSGEASLSSMSAIAKKSGIAIVGGLSASPQQRISLADVLVTPRLSDVDTAKAIARNLSDLNRRRVIVLAERDAQSTARAQVYLKALQAIGGFESKLVQVAEQTNRATAVLPEIVEFRPTAVVLLIGYEAAADFIRTARTTGSAFYFYVTSDIGTAAISALLGNGIKGVILLSATPIASDNKSAIVRQFRQDMSAYASGVTPDELALEGYFAARLTLEAIRRSGKTPTSEQVKRILNTESIVLGEITFRQTNAGTVLNIQPELAIFSSDGRLIY